MPNPLALLSRPSRAALLRRLSAASMLAVALAFGAACSPPVDEVAVARREALDLISLADALYANREFEAARQHYRRAHERSPRPGALLGMARCLIAQERLAEAAPILDDVIAASPEHREAVLLRQKVRAVLVRQDLEGQARQDAARDAAAAAGSEDDTVAPTAERGGTTATPSDAAPDAAADAIADAAPDAPPAALPDDPALRRPTSLAFRRAEAGIAAEEDYPSAQNVAKARLAVAEYDPEEDRRTVAELRELLAEEAAKTPPDFPSDEEIAAVWFNVGDPPAERGLSANRLAANSAFYVERARTLVTDGRLAEARAALHEALQRNPRDADALIELGALYDRLGEGDRAREQYEAALALAPDTARAWYRLGNSFLLQAYPRRWADGYHRAIVAYDKALVLQPDYTFALNNKASALMELGNFEDARVALVQATRLDPGYAAPYRNLGIISERHDKHLVRALSYYKEYLALDGADRVNVSSWVREIERELSGR